MTKGTAGFLAFLAGLLGITAVTYLVAPELFSGKVPPAETTAVSTTSDSTVEKPADATSEATEIAKADTKSGRVQAGVVPSFDVLRVEPDGSMVLAGKAAPGSKVEMMNGDAVIASATAGALGDFVIILDEPLSSGDYQLTLKSTAGDGTTQLSEEVATVAIPEDGKGELLAMVSKPGEPSRILAQPEAVGTETPATEMASADTAVATDAAKPADQAAAPAAPATADAATAAGAASTEQPAAGTATATDAGTAPAAAPKGDAASVVLPELPSTSQTLAGAAPEIATGKTDVASATPETPAAEPVAPAAGTETAAPATDAAPQAAPTTEVASAQATVIPASDATVRVDAVEIEGDMIFIAGSATAGYSVRISADNVVVGSAVADENGRFIVEATSPLSVGDHTISADLIAPGSTTVVLRAAVPFNRPEGNAVAAVAGAAPQASASGSAGSLQLPELASLDGLRSDAFGALTNFAAMLAAPGTSDADKLAEAKSDLISKLGTVIDAPVPDAASADAKAGAEAVRNQARSALAAIEPMQLDAATLPDLEKMKAMRGSVGDALAGLSRPVMPADATAQMAAMAPDLRDLARMREQAFGALSAYDAMLNGSETPDADELAKARAEAMTQLQAVIDAADPATASAEAAMAAQGMRNQASDAMAALMAGEGPATDAAAMKAKRESARSALNALAKPSEAMVAALADMPATEPSAAPATDGPATINQAPLTQSPHAVIIRRGDTLWQISRRTYGEGVRYTTIYLANLSQIQNPDMIKPGQVFSVPDEPLPNAVELHRKRLEEMKKK